MKPKFTKFSERYILRINKAGFSLWDNYDNRWIIDASCLVESDTFEIGKDKAAETHRSRFSVVHHYRIKPFKRKRD